MITFRSLPRIWSQYDSHHKITESSDDHSAYQVPCWVVGCLSKNKSFLSLKLFPDVEITKQESTMLSWLTLPGALSNSYQYVQNYSSPLSPGALPWPALYRFPGSPCTRSLKSARTKAGEGARGFLPDLFSSAVWTLSKQVLEKNFPWTRTRCSKIWYTGRRSHNLWNNGEGRKRKCSFSSPSCFRLWIYFSSKTLNVR